MTGDPVREETGGGDQRLRIVERVLRADRYDSRNCSATEVAAALLAELDAVVPASASSSRDEASEVCAMLDHEDCMLPDCGCPCHDAVGLRNAIQVARAHIAFDRHEQAEDTLAAALGDIEPPAPSVSQQGTGERERALMLIEAALISEPLPPATVGERATDLLDAIAGSLASVPSQQEGGGDG